MSWTSPQDVLDAWIGDDAPDDTDLIQNWIDKAERLIRKAVPDIQERIDDDETDLLDNAIDVVVAMVQRRFRNPDGTRQVSSTTGPFSEQRTYGGDDPGAFGLLASEMDILTLDGDGVSGAFDIDLTPSTSFLHRDFVPWWSSP